jgi:hypothetical protein
MEGGYLVFQRELLALQVANFELVQSGMPAFLVERRLKGLVTFGEGL